MLMSGFDLLEVLSNPCALNRFPLNKVFIHHKGHPSSINCN